MSLEKNDTNESDLLQYTTSNCLKKCHEIQTHSMGIHVLDNTCRDTLGFLFYGSLMAHFCFKLVMALYITCTLESSS